ncbi:MAG: hypothetical protein PX481_03070 [Microcystis sp. M53603_WE2]|uniref:hypothetical protein n=1 Tax=Microcystis sp. LE19-10.1B TaxID=3016428 RepID=UPI0022BD8D87|nr:hypothetical protein [Microcystis sp. LE19-10.1B]MCZ8365306.1 hypothetical protein [Microcystis sp. LE19-251.1A]MDJ0537686.1 hypothetical protein [Microcystis sp. M53603_WE2]MDJ0604328.1 hypothetical protein [Microcystis sp. M53602_WE12]
MKITTFLTIALITWIAHFWYFNHLGLYEDDYAFIGNILTMDFSRFVDSVKNMNLAFFQGRVVGFNILFFSAYFAGKLGGLPLIYISAYLLALTNNILFYLFLQRLWNQPIFVLTGTLAFTLFPADNTRAFLTHIHILPAITFLLLAFLSYLNDKKIWSYLLITASFLSYETCFLLFITAPFLTKKPQSEIFKELIKHLFILGTIFLVVLILRKLTGDSRVGDLDIATAIFTPIRQIITGPFVCLGTFVYRPWQTLHNLRGELLIFVPLSLLMLLWLFLQNSRFSGLDSGENWPIIKQLSLLGISLLFLAYPLTFTVPATLISGRDSRVHAAGVVGASILGGILGYLIVYLANSYRQKNLAALLLATYFSLLIGFGIIVQQQNKLSWKYQQAFWADVIQLAPDLSDGQVILVDAPSLPWGSQLYPFAWSMPSVVGQLYQFPWQWKNVPKLYKLNPDWQLKIAANGEIALNNDNGLLFFYYPWEPARQVKTSEIILLQEKDGKLVRTTTPIVAGAKKFSFKPLTNSTIDSFDKGYLYDYLIAPNNKKSVNYFQPF